MSTTVDTNVVKMVFDNQKFEEGISSSTDKVNKFKDTLKFDKVSDSFKSVVSNIKDAAGKIKDQLDFGKQSESLKKVGDTAKEVNFDPMTNGLSVVKEGFNALDVIAIRVLQNITDKVQSVASQLVDALTLEPLRDGFAEYETQMNAVQTILANTSSKGTTLNDVNNALDELNTYADKTIYNFTEMTRNIGTFTAAGVDLDNSVSAIQGIANLAAVSGSNSEQASRAMYQLSQALAAGTVHLQDWNSVVNAGMGGEVFQKAIMDTARVHGIAIDDMMESAGNFRGLLNAKDWGDWLNSDILLESLQKFTAGSEGITKQQLEQMQQLYRERGYTEDQIKSLTEAQTVLTDEQIEENKAMWEAKGYTREQVDEIFQMGQMATDAATKVKTFSQLIDTLKEGLGSGWTQSWEYIIGDFEQAKALWSEIYEVLSIYINASANARNATLKEWSEGGGRAAVIDALRNSFQALLGVILPVKQAFDQIFPAINAKQLIEYSNRLKEFTAGLKVSDEQADKIRKTAITLFTSLKTGVDGVKNVAKTLKDIFSAIGEAIRNSINVDEILYVIGTITQDFYRFTNAIKPSEEVLTNLVKIVTGVISVLKTLGLIALDAGSALFNALGDVFMAVAPKGAEFMEILGLIGDKLQAFSITLRQSLNFSVFMGGLENLAKAFIDIYNAAIKFIGLDGIFDWFKKLFSVSKEGEESGKILQVLADIFGKLTQKISEFTGNIDLGSLDFGKILELAASGVIFKKLYDILSNVSDFLSKTLPESLNGFDRFKKDLGDIIGNITKNFTVLKDSIVSLAEELQVKVKADIFRNIAIALAIMVGALWVLSTIDAEHLIASIGAVSILLAEIVKVMQTLSAMDKIGFKSASRAATAMMKISASILILAQAVKSIGSLETDQITKGLLAITILLFEMTKVAQGLAKTNGNMAKGATSLVLLAYAVKVLAEPVKELGSMDFWQMMQGLLGVTAMIAGLALASKKLSDMKMTAGIGLILLAASIKILASAVEQLSAIKYDQLMNGLKAFAVILGGVTIAANNMPKGLISAGIGLIAMAAAITIMANAVQLLSNIPYDNIKVGLSGFAIILGGVTLAANLLPKDMMAKSIGLVVFAAAIGMMSESLTKLSNIPYDNMKTGIIGLAAVVGALAIAALAFSSKSMDPVKIAAVSASLLIFSAAIAVISGSLALLSQIPWPGLLIAIGAIAAVFLVLGGAALVLGPLVPVILALAGSLALLGAGCLAFGAGIGLAAAGLALLAAAIAGGGLALIEFLRQLINLLPEVGTKLGEMLVNLATKIGEAGPQLVQAISAIITSILTALQENIPLVVETLLSLLSQILQSIAVHVPEMANAALQFIGGFLQAIAENLPSILDSAITIVVTFITGIAERLPDIIDAAFKLIIGFIDGLATAIDNNHNALFDAVGHLITSIVTAIVDGIVHIAEGAGQLIQGFLDEFDLGKIGKSLSDIGMNLVNGIIGGITDFADSLWTEAGNLAQGALDMITGVFKENSPSKKGYEAGKYLDEGVRIGIAKNSDSVAKEAGKMADGTLQALSDTLSNNEFDVDASIKPSVDTSKFRKANTKVMTNMLKATAKSASKVVGSVEKMGNDVIDVLYHSLDEHSPSKKGYEAGEFLGEGVSLGIDASSKDAEKSSSKFASGILSAMSDSLEGIDSITGVLGKTISVIDKGLDGTSFNLTTTIDESSFDKNNDYVVGVLGNTMSLFDSISDKEYSPTITPILDDSKVQNGIASIFGSLSPIQATSDIQDNIRVKQEINAKIADAITTENDYSSITSELSQLRGEMAHYTEVMSNIGIVMDSGVLVGELTPGIDSALGRASMLQRRGV